MPIQTDEFTPDSIRNKELDTLRSEIKRGKRRGWFLFVLGLTLGAVISWALTLVL